MTRELRMGWNRVAALLIAVVVVAAALGRRPPAPSPTPAAPAVDLVREAPPRPRGLDPALLAALRRARADAAGQGVQIVVESGRRSPEHQERLLDEAVAKYGSRAQAARWVATPETSAHVSGDAIDVGPAAARSWLAAHGAQYGLCQIYANEPWHYELRPDAVEHGCPPVYADPTHDPRMHG